MFINNSFGSKYFSFKIFILDKPRACHLSMSFKPIPLLTENKL